MPIGGDGFIEDAKTGETWPTEHVYVKPNGDQDGMAEQLVLAAIERKQRRGPAYGAGKILVVFLNAVAGSYYPNQLARRLLADLPFAVVWVLGLQYVEDGRYTYGVTMLAPAPPWGCPIFRVHIHDTFEDWTIEQRQ
jgi:hypothetical protein